MLGLSGKKVFQGDQKLIGLTDDIRELAFKKLVSFLIIDVCYNFSILKKREREEIAWSN